MHACMYVCEGCLVGNMSSTQCSNISQQQICSGQLPPLGLIYLSLSELK